MKNPARLPSLPAAALTALLLPSLLLGGPGCVTNPARQLTQNSDEMKVNPDGTLLRGDEELDEQEFYTLVNDTESAQKIADARGAGELNQTLGIAGAVTGVLLVLGLGAVALYTTSNAEQVNELVGADNATLVQYVPLLGILAGMGLAGGGGYLYLDGRTQASGETRIFNASHAQDALENGLYGAGGAKPQDVARLELATTDGVNHYCSVGGIAFAPLKAFDAQGRPMKVDGRKDWFKWESVATVSEVGMVSPLTTGLEQLGKPIEVKVSVPESGAEAKLTLTPDYACPNMIVDFSASSGAYGSSGGSGSSGSGAGGTGGDGSDGGDGGDGDDNSSIEIEATTIPAPDGNGKLVVAAIKKSTADLYVAVFDASKQLVVSGRGGMGGGGGSGGRGGSGASFNSSDCRAGGDGGRGGRGGKGGRGGAGADVSVRVTDDSVARALAVVVDGGSGGTGGAAGDGGSGGSSDRCGDSSIPAGKSGTDGTRGTDGSGGKSGKVNVQTAQKSALKMLAPILAK